MRITLLVIAVAAGTVPAAAQGIYTADLLRDLPAGGNIFALIEAAQPEITTDRFNSGGLNGGSADKAGAFLASWSQTQYRIGDVPISSPVDGTPMLFPELAWWNKINVATALMPSDSSATGLAISLEPMTAANRWTATLEMTASDASLSEAASPDRPPAIQALDEWTQVTALASGRLMNGRLGLLLGGSRTAATTVERNLEVPRQQTGSAFANASFSISPDKTVGALAWVSDASFHAQATFRRGAQWRLFGGYTDHTIESARPSGGRLAVDRLVDGPISLLVDRGGHEKRFIAGSRHAKQLTRHALTFGGDLERTSFAAAPTFSGVIEERVNGVPARVWRYSSPGLGSHRRALAVNVFAADHVSVSSKVTLDASLRFESADASTHGVAQGIHWRSWLPGIYVNWDLGTAWQLRLLTGVSRAADEVKLGLLAYGDPAAPTADIYRWTGGPLSGAPLVGRVGPGTGGDPAFVTIDPELRRPMMDQFALGIEGRPVPKLKVNILGLARRQSPQIHGVNIGVPVSGYTTFTIHDAYHDTLGAADDQLLTIYNRRPEMYASDRYLLTNPDVMPATMASLIVGGELTTKHVYFRMAGTLVLSGGAAGNRGFTAVENDLAMTGELFADPNAATYARGQLFNDRMYTIKTLSVVTLPRDIHVGVIGRYQDGQAFSRMVIVPDLNQGTEAVRSFPTGRSRFTFRSTIDVRLQKRVAARGAALDLFLDTYNLLNMSNEVEEYVVTGPRYRETTAVQPPRSFHLGTRISF
jgi:hypothetical protein